MPPTSTPPFYSLSLPLPSLCLFKRAKLRSCRCSSHASLAASLHLSIPPPPSSSSVNRMYNMHTTLPLSLCLSFLHTSTTIWHPQKLLCVQCGVCLIFSTVAVFQLLFHSLKAIFKLRAHHTQLTINRHQRQKGAWLFACCCRCLCLVASLTASLSRADKVGGGEGSSSWSWLREKRSIR